MTVGTIDGDIGRPFGGAFQNTLLDALHVLRMYHFGDIENFPDLLKDLRLVPLTDLHPVFHSHDHVLCAIFSTRLGTLLCSS